MFKSSIIISSIENHKLVSVWSKVTNTICMILLCQEATNVQFPEFKLANLSNLDSRSPLPPSQASCLGKNSQQAATAQSFLCPSFHIPVMMMKEETQGNSLIMPPSLS